MTLLIKVTTNIIHFSVHPVSQLRADASGTEMLILLLCLAVQLDLRTVVDRLFAMFTVQLKNVYGDSLVLLVQRSCFQTLSWS